MKKLKLSEIKQQAEVLHGNLELYKFYDIRALNLKVESPNGPVDIVSFVVKHEDSAVVEFESGLSISCAANHYLNTPEGSIRVCDLNVGEIVNTRDGTDLIKNITISDQKSEYYDIEVDSDCHLFTTSDGIVHHNTGKTHTVEKVLHAAGLRDGKGYFKNTGSASAAGMYSLLFRYKDKIILFDDSDDALKDQESRNLIKAATDTKKSRKLVWNKMGKNVVDPDDDLTDEEILDQNLIPRHFEFTGRIIFISNLSMDKLDPDGAIRTRSFMIDINPTEMEVYDFMEKIADDIKLEDGLSLSSAQRKNVVNLLRKGKSKQTANFRKLSRGLNMAAGAAAAGVSINEEDLARMIATYA